MKEKSPLSKQIMAWIMTVCMVLSLFTAITVAKPVEAKAASDSSFVHPGILHTEESIAAMKRNIAANVEPTISAYNALKSDGFSDASWAGRPLEQVVRGGDGNNCAQLYIDIQRAYQTALLWRLGAGDQYGDAAVRILNGWSSTMTSLTGNSDRYLCGIYGYQMANAAELVRDHEDFDVEAMSTLLVDVFYPLNHRFFLEHNGASVENYWANWDLANIASMIAIGVFADRQDIYEEAVSYYKNGEGMGSVFNAMPYVYEEGTYDEEFAQWQELHRDQGHTTLGIGLCGAINEIAWSQGDNLYGLSDNRFLKAVECVVRYNNNGEDDVPFSNYTRYNSSNGKWETGDGASPASRGQVRPVYTLVYNHYVNRMGLEAPELEKWLYPEGESARVEGLSSRNGDEPGVQSLTFHNISTRTEGAKAAKEEGGLSDGTYIFCNNSSGKALVDNSGALGTADKGTMDTEQWKVKNLGDAQYIVTNAKTGRIIQLDGSEYTSNSSVYKVNTNFTLSDTKTEAKNQKLAFFKGTDTDVYRIALSASSFVMSEKSGTVFQDKYIGRGDRAHSSCLFQEWKVEKVADAEKEQGLIADFSFDNAAEGLAGAGAVAATEGNLTFVDDEERGKVLYLSDNAWLNVTSEDGTSLLSGNDELTFSFYSKAASAGTNWGFYAAANTTKQTSGKEKYIGLYESGESVKAERYNTGRTTSVNGTCTTGWDHIVVVYAADGLRLYVNGKLAAEKDCDSNLEEILGTESILQIGKANWGNGEYFTGKMDDFKIYNYALTEDEVKAIKSPQRLAMFTFDSESEGFAGNRAKAANAGTPVLTEDAVSGKALQLDGTGKNYLTITDAEGSALLSGSKELTVSYWSKTTGSSANWVFYASASDAEQTYQKERYLGIYEEKTALTAQRYNNNGSRPQSSGTQIVQDEWKHVTMVCSEDATRIYVNGELQSETASSYVLSDIVGEDGVVYIGKANWKTGEYYNGLVDEVSIYNYALEESEVKALYDENALYGETLKVHYDMSHSDGKLTDVTGNGFDAKMYGIEESDFSTIDGETVLTFDGTDKYVEIPAGAITGERFIIEAEYQTETESSAWLFNIGTTTGVWPNVKNYLFVSPISSDTANSSAYKGSLLGAIKDDSKEYRYPTDKILTTDKTTKNVVRAEFDNGNVTYYLNGESSAVTETSIKIQDLISANSTESAIGYIGKSLYTADADYAGTLTDFKIYNEEAEVEEITPESAVEKTIQNIHIPNVVRKNIVLPVTGENETQITWKSSNTNVISANGTVNRKDTDTEVTLEATLTNGSYSVTKSYTVIVKAAGSMDESKFTDYLFAYFVGDGSGEEKIFLASSRDGMHWTELNDGKPVIESELGTTGLRDPYIMRSPEGDKFYMIATDLCIGSGTSWSDAQKKGSQAIMIWESEDLINWSEQRMAVISDSISAGCTWAPEAFYDEELGEFIVFWASKIASDNYAKQRVYYVTTSDFVNFSEPQVWIDESVSTIDSTVVQDEDGTYYRFSKNESETYVYLEKADSLLGEWTAVNANIASGVEGPTCFKLNADDVSGTSTEWCLLLDAYGGDGYYPLISTDISSGVFSSVADYELPANPRHGTVINITEEEYNALVQAYGAGDAVLTEDSLPNFVVPGYELPESVEVEFDGNVTMADVVWENTAEDFQMPGNVVTVKGTIPSMANSVVTKKIEVISDKLIYFVDSGVGSWNDKKNTSGNYEDVKAVTELRNTVADQKYANGSWGIVNAGENTDGVAVVAHESASSSIYENGWWARSGMNCEYVFPLEAGSYAVSGYFSEYWWENSYRSMQFYAEYTDDSGNVVRSEIKNVSVSIKDNNKKVTAELVVKNVADMAEVHVYAVKDNADPVISGVTIEKYESEDALKAQLVMNLINAIGKAELTEACLERITEARTSYDALSDAQKALVTNISVLETAETEYSVLEEQARADAAAANAVIEKIAAIGTVTADAACKARIDEAKTAYTNLTDAQKALVTNKTVLDAAETEYNALKAQDDAAKEQAKADAAAANAVIEKIAAIGTVRADAACKARIDEAKTAYTNLTDTQKALVTNKTVLDAAEAVYNDLIANEEQPGYDSNNPSETPGQENNNPSETPGQENNNPSGTPGQENNNPSGTPGQENNNPSETPGQENNNPSGTPGQENNNSSETPEQENNNPSETPEQEGTAALEQTQQTIMAANTDAGDVAGSTFAALKLKAKEGKKSIKLSWSKINGASGYAIYGAQCGKKMKLVKELSAGKKSFTVRKLKAGKYYKYMVVAYKNIAGEKRTIETSVTVHCAVKGGKNGNPTGIVYKKTNVTVKKGRTFTLKPKLKKKTKVKTHIAKFRYESSNPSVATVNKKGKIKGISKGSCYIYMYTQNGLYKRVKVKVK